MSSSLDATIDGELNRMELIEYSSDEGRDVDEIHERLLEMSDSLPEGPPTHPPGAVAPSKGSNFRLPLEALRKMRRKVRRRGQAKNRSSSNPTPPPKPPSPDGTENSNSETEDGEICDNRGGSSPPKKTRNEKGGEEPPPPNSVYDFGLNADTDEWLEDDYVGTRKGKDEAKDGVSSDPPLEKEEVIEDGEGDEEPSLGEVEGGRKEAADEEAPGVNVIRTDQFGTFDPTTLSAEAVARGPFYMVSQWVFPYQLQSPAGVIAIMANPHQFWRDRDWPSIVFIRTAGTKWLYARKAKYSAEKHRVKLGSRILIKDVQKRTNPPVELIARHLPEIHHHGKVHWARFNKRLNSYNLQYTATAGMAKVQKVPRRDDKVRGIITELREDGSVGVRNVPPTFDSSSRTSNSVS